MDYVSKKVVPVVSPSESGKTGVNQREYTAPKLTEYGDIASLVKLVVVGGVDGGVPPFTAMS